MTLLTPGQFLPRPQAGSCAFPGLSEHFPSPQDHRFTGSPLHLTHGPYPSSGRAPSAIYLCIYLFIYLLFYLISWLHPGTVWLSQLDWEVEEQGQQGHSSLWVWGEDHPFQRPELLRKRPGEMGGAEPADPQLAEEGPSEGPISGQVPGLLSFHSGSRKPFWTLLLCFLFIPLSEGPQVPGTD